MRHEVVSARKEVELAKNRKTFYPDLKYRRVSRGDDSRSRKRLSFAEKLNIKRYDDYTTANN